MRERIAGLLAALLLLTACGGGNGGTCALCGGSSAFAATADSCVAHINALRASIGLDALARWSDAESCADSEAESDSGSGQAHGAFGRCNESAQNECPGWGAMTGAGGIVPGCLDMMWAEGPGPYSGHGHYVNMTNPAYTKVACGFHVTSGGAIWAVQDFR